MTTGTIVSARAAAVSPRRALQKARKDQDLKKGEKGDPERRSSVGNDPPCANDLETVTHLPARILFSNFRRCASDVAVDASSFRTRQPTLRNIPDRSPYLRVTRITSATCRESWRSKSRRTKVSDTTGFNQLKPDDQPDFLLPFTGTSVFRWSYQPISRRLETVLSERGQPFAS